MSDDYGIPYQRRSKKDLRKKRKNRVYKRGGTFRGVKFTHNNGQKQANKNS